MATQTLSTAPSRAALPGAGLLAALLRGIAIARGAQARFDRIRRLQALSDAELARRGIARDDIVRHVFADAFDA